MTTKVDVSNGALTMIGEAPKVTALSPPAGGPHATLCATLLPRSIETVLSMADWTFASARMPLEAVALAVASVNATNNAITTATAHGMVDDDRVRIELVSGTLLPSPLEADTDYYVIEFSSGLAMRLAETAGGEVIDITTTGTGSFRLLKQSDRASWAFAYAAPTDMLRSRKVVPAGAPDEDFPGTMTVPAPWPLNRRAAGPNRLGVIPFSPETNRAGERVIYTNEEDPDLRYTRSIDDLAQWDPLAINALEAEQARRLAGALSKDRKVVESCETSLARWMAEAKFSNAMQRSIQMPDTYGWDR